MGFEIEDKQIETTDKGFLRSFDNWDKKTALYLASTESITLTEDHWELISLLRDYYEKYQQGPMLKVLIKIVAEKKKIEKHIALRLIFSLFPQGNTKQACKIAGLPYPTQCI